MTANFSSDNETPVAPAMMEAIIEANQGTATAYAEDKWSGRLDQAFSELFRTEAVVLPVSTGTVANSIALATLTPPWGSVYCHQSAHIQNDESGAPEFFGNGLRLVPVAGEPGKLNLETLEQSIRATQGHGVHSYLPSALSLTQSTESGTVYTADEIHGLCDFAHGLEMKTHMDGARFANAVASLGCHPAEITCEAGIDMLSFGASKNGCMAAEALVIFKQPQWRETAERLRKRSGHLLSKMRYISAQLLAYIENDHWLDMATHANRHAAKFADVVQAHPQASLEYPVQANEVFVKWTTEGFTQLESQNILFQRWPGRDDLARFVFGHSTTDQETRFLISALDQIPKPGP
ncbi:MAG: low specificity L-threonine aldolase [Gammaproteobacteria bacterium]|nr:MAG: low specificity L-threonine aldolase [Gammaproteobacteria bacterium]